MTPEPRTGPTIEPSGLRHRIIRIAYVVVNVSDLERARAFYEQVSPLRVVARTRGPAQRFAGLGIEHGEFDGYLLDDGTGGQPTAVHLVRWATPAPVGETYPVFWHVGLAKLGFVMPDPGPKLARLAELGVRPTNDPIRRGYVTVADPDGVLLSFFTDPSVRHERLVHTNPSVRDVDRSLRFYRDLLGLDLHLDSVPPEPRPASQGPGSDRSQWDSHLLSARGDRRFSVDVSQFHFPPPTPETLTPHAEANHLGISRIGFEVDDIDAAYETLRAADPVGAAPAPVGPPEEWDHGPEVGVRRVVTFRDPDGIRLELVQQPPRSPSSYLT